MTNSNATPKHGKPIHYNQNAEEYAESGKVEVAAREAVEALDDAEQAVELQKAETAGKSHANRPRMQPPPTPREKAKNRPPQK